MEKNLLSLTPKHFLCPYCGEWHEWDKPHDLGYYDSKSCKACFECVNAPLGSAGNYRFYFADGYFYYSINRICEKANQTMNGKIPISSIDEDPDQSIVSFVVKFPPEAFCKSLQCSHCAFINYCNFSLGNYSCNQNIEFGFEFEEYDYNLFSKTSQLAQEEQELDEELDEELNQELDEPAQQEIKEDATMTNNILNMNMEFGPNKDENIASTLMGIAVKNGDSWRIYDKSKKEITDIGDMQLGNLPIFILPTTKLSEGDLIKDAGEYYFVMKVAKGSTQTLCVKTGEMKTVIPIKNVLGFSCYCKIIALSDSINMGDDFDVEKLAIMSAMCGQSGKHNEQINALLPLMLLKEKDGSDDDMTKMILLSSMMSVPTEGDNPNATMNQLLPLMLLKEKDGGDDDMTKMILLSSMMGGNMAGNNNPVMNYLMLDMLMDKKNGEQPPQQSVK